MNLDHWFRRKCHLKISSRALAAQNVLQRTIFGEGKYYTIIDLCSGRHGVLVNSKHHIDRPGAEVNMINFTVQLHSMSTET